MKKLILLFTLAVAGFAALAQPGFQVFDVAHGFASSSPQYVTAFGTKICFYANKNNKGTELFVTNGTDSAILTDDINPLTANAITGNKYKHPAIEYNGKFYFSANNGSLGQEIYGYAGSGLPAIVWDLEPGAAGSFPDNFATATSGIYFTATTAASGTELFRLQPSVPKVDQITDINVGPDTSVTGNVIVFGNKVYFTAKTAAKGNELYVYDPVLSKDTMVADIKAGASSSDPLDLTVIDSKLYFTADNGINGRELFVYDGTNPPQRITDVNPGISSSIPIFNAPIVAGLNGKVYFTAAAGNFEYDIYVYDPATGNTTLACKTNKNGSSDAMWLTAYDGKLVFSANDTNGVNNFELWSYSGSGPAIMMADICNNGGSQPAQFVVIGKVLFFRADDCDSAGEELFKYDPQTISVQKVSFAGKATFYPNPAQTIAYIDLQLNASQSLSLSITDITGRVVYSTSSKSYGIGNNSIDVPLQSLTPGSYFYHLLDANGKHCTGGKFIKQ